MRRVLASDQARGGACPRRLQEGNTAGTSPAARRVAVIAPAYGDTVLGGAERSLRLIAQTLATKGYHVEVFTTGHGDETVGGVHVHRFPDDPADQDVLAAATQAL